LITLVYESDHELPVFENKMREISGVEEVKCVCISSKDLSKGFNKALKESAHELMVFLRKGVTIYSENWAKVIIDAFSMNSHGIIGTLGTLIVPKSGMLWEKEEPLCGTIWYEKYSDDCMNRFGEAFNGKILDVISLEGSLMAVHKDRLATTFDERFLADSFFDYDFCIDNYKKGVKVGVIFGVDIVKESFDEQDEDFEKNHKKFLDKYEDLPYRIAPQVFIDHLLVQTESTPLVHVIIPVKDNVDELFACLESIYIKTKYTSFKVTIALYDASIEDKAEILAFSAGYKNLNLFESPQQQIAKILNHVTEEIESDLVVFLSQHVVFENDVISLMVNTYLKNPETCGSVGIRTHQKNRTVRQFGLHLFSFETDEGSELGLDLKGFGKAFAYKNEIVNGVMGNSIECFLINRDLFLNLGKFNPSYNHSLEDFEFNLKLILSGKTNYLVGNAVGSFHGIGKPKFIPKDYLLLMDYVNDHIDSLLPYVTLVSA
jgi:GT2 family glycosyltransferase